MPVCPYCCPLEPGDLVWYRDDRPEGKPIRVVATNIVLGSDPTPYVRVDLSGDGTMLGLVRREALVRVEEG